jgi:hypothetical protein
VGAAGDADSPRDDPGEYADERENNTMKVLIVGGGAEKSLLACLPQ